MSIAAARDAAPDYQAVVFDFNGTLSQDEGIQFEIYAELCAEHGLRLSQSEYVHRLVGRSDRELVLDLLGPDVDVDAIVRERVCRYKMRTADGSTVSPATRDAVVFASTHVPIAVVTSAFRDEVVPVLRAAGLIDLFSATVFADDVTHEKPDPESYLLACEHLRVEPRHALAIEDTDTGVTAALAAGLRCVAVTTTLPRPRLEHAHALIDVLTVDRLATFLTPGVGHP